MFKRPSHVHAVWRGDDVVSVFTSEEAAVSFRDRLSQQSVDMGVYDSLGEAYQAITVQPAKITYTRPPRVHAA